MRSLFDTDEEEEIEGKASEITLSTASLLGIFFGLVLICGVFFGFGYSMGRGTGSGSPGEGIGKPACGKRTRQLLRQTLPQPAPTQQPEEAPQASEKIAPPPAITRAKPADAPAPDASREDSPGDEAPAKPVTPVRQASRWPAGGSLLPPDRCTA